VTRAMFALGVPAAMAADTVLFALLRRARPQPFGLSSPTVHPAMLRSARQSELRSFTSVVLSYGRPLTAAGQLIEVETCFAETSTSRLSSKRPSPGLSCATKPGPGETGQPNPWSSGRPPTYTSQQPVSTTTSALWWWPGRSARCP
jgi:hypothetical protein